VTEPAPRPDTAREDPSELSPPTRRTLRARLANRQAAPEEFPMSRISPCLWFDHQAEEAARFYTSIFPNSKIHKISYYGDAGPGPKGTVMTVDFVLDGQRIMALNAGPQFKFNEAISLSVECRTQSEVDRFWERLSEGGEQGPCGWLKDKYGLSWQVNPTVLGEMLSDPDASKANRVMKAMLQMKKIEIEDLERAYAGAGV
jgi:predicted 3-demethylubiquinone-9 3-methyltransferase (glyoxalase superfamily)